MRHFLFGPIRIGAGLMLVAALAAVILASLNTNTALAAPTLDGSPTTCSSGTNVTSRTWSHTVGSGSNRLLLVGVSLRTDSGQSVSTVTYGLQSFTKVGHAVNGNFRAEIWRLVAPNTGTASITVTLSASTPGIICGSTSWTGVDQTNPTGPAFTNTGTSPANQPSVTVTSASGEVVHDTLAADTGESSTVSVGSGQTQRWQQRLDSNIIGAGSTEAGPHQ